MGLIFLNKLSSKRRMDHKSIRRQIKINSREILRLAKFEFNFKILTKQLKLKIMNSNHSSKKSKTRKWCLIFLMILTGLGIATFTALGFTNEFSEFFNYSTKEWMETGLGIAALISLILYFVKLVKSNMSNNITTT